KGRIFRPSRSSKREIPPPIYPYRSNIDVRTSPCSSPFPVRTVASRDGKKIYEDVVIRPSSLVASLNTTINVEQKMCRRPDLEGFAIYIFRGGEGGVGGEGRSRQTDAWVSPVVFFDPRLLLLRWWSQRPDVDGSLGIGSDMWK
ncbi:hypothetical protein GWI33_001559, partial [Rhynchophorus ferrugineus]